MLSNGFTNLNLTDMETCYKMLTNDALKKILPTLQQNRFGFEPELTAKLLIMDYEYSRWESVTREEHMLKARKSVGKMVSKPSGAF